MSSQVDEIVADTQGEINPHWGSQVGHGGLIWCWHCGNHFRKPQCEEGIWHHASELSSVDGSCPCERAAMAAELEERRLAEQASTPSTSTGANGNGHHNHTPRTERRRGNPCERRPGRPGRHTGHSFDRR